MSSYMYFDKDGIIVESSSEQLPGVPVITGLEFGHIVLHQPLPVADQDIFGEILNLTQVLNVSDIQVDKINYNSYNEAELVMGDITVELGNSDSLDGKIAELHDIMTELTGLSGTLYLDTYDETNSSPTYRFAWARTFRGSRTSTTTPSGPSRIPTPPPADCRSSGAIWPPTAAW